MSELGSVGGYQKNVDKSNTAGGYHTPPPNYSNSLMNQQPHPGQSNAPPPTQYAYMASMIGATGANPNTAGLVNPHTGIQQPDSGINSRGGAGGQPGNNLKSLPQTNYANSSWNGPLTTACTHLSSEQGAAWFHHFCLFDHCFMTIDH